MIGQKMYQVGFHPYLYPCEYKMKTAIVTTPPPGETGQWVTIRNHDAWTTIRNNGDWHPTPQEAIQPIIDDINRQRDQQIAEVKALVPSADAIKTSQT